MIGTFLALKRARAVLTAPQIRSICKVWNVGTTIHLENKSIVVSLSNEKGNPIASLKSEYGIMPWMVIAIPTQYGVERTVLATASVREAAAALTTLLETAKK